MSRRSESYASCTVHYSIQVELATKANLFLISVEDKSIRSRVPAERFSDFSLLPQAATPLRPGGCQALMHVRSPIVSSSLRSCMIFEAQDIARSVRHDSIVLKRRCAMVQAMQNTQRRVVAYIQQPI